jgi:hypothetical protein
MRTYLPSQLTTAVLLLTAALGAWIVTVGGHLGRGRAGVTKRVTSPGFPTRGRG